MSIKFSSQSLGMLLKGELPYSTVISWLRIGLAQIKEQRKLVFLFVLIGGLTGGIGFLMYPQKFKAEMMIAIEDEKASGWENLLAQFGIDVADTKGGVFTGESLLQLFTSRYMLERTLLTPHESLANGQTFADQYLENSHWSKKTHFKGCTFPSERSGYSAKQDSLIWLLYKEIKKEVVSAEKPDKKQSIIRVYVTHENREFAKNFLESLVQNTSNFYVETLTSKARANLNVLRKEADSVEVLLRQNMVRSAYEGDIHLNPIRQSLKVNQNRALVDLQVSVSLYGELIKNLKLAEIGLRKQTPLIQVIDRPSYPLSRTGLPIGVWIALGSMLGFFASIWVVFTLRSI
jgi:hypothetical protein